MKFKEFADADPRPPNPVRPAVGGAGAGLTFCPPDDYFKVGIYPLNCNDVDPTEHAQ
jgi:hypothetical protein